MQRQVICGAVALVFATSGAAQRATPSGATTPRRVPIVAGFLGALPGLGHAYAGEPRRGLAVAGVWLAGGFMALNSSQQVVANVGGLLILGSHVFSIADAALAAERFNRRHALTTGPRISVRPAFPSERSGCRPTP
jgi:hypothetical protein